MDSVRIVGLVGASLVFLLLCLGLGWGPTDPYSDPERLALLGIAATGLVWPAVVLRIVGHFREVERS